MADRPTSARNALFPAWLLATAARHTRRLCGQVEAQCRNLYQVAPFRAAPDNCTIAHLHAGGGGAILPIPLIVGTSAMGAAFSFGAGTSDLAHATASTVATGLRATLQTRRRPSITERNRDGRKDSGKSLDARRPTCESLCMQDESDPSVHLLRIDAGRNMRRFYAAGLQPTLFGGASVMRYWGRIGSSGRIMIETFESPEEARLALGKLVRGKRKRGYFEGKDPCAVSEERPDSEAPLIDTTEERPAGRLHRLSND